MELLHSFLFEELKIRDEKIIDKFILSNKLLLDWNLKINLISRNSKSIETQVCNSLFFLPYYKIENKSNILDVGTGGGFPGIPLKILYPDLNITLLDSIQKKTNALKQILNDLGLSNVKVICNRAEELGKDIKYKNSFDIVIAKSVSSLENLYKWCKDLKKTSGKLLFIKGGDIMQEIADLKKIIKNAKINIFDCNLNKKFCITDKKIIIIE